MSDYVPSLRDIRFVLEQLVDLDAWVPQLNVRLLIRIWLLTCKNVPDPGTSHVYLAIPTSWDG